MSSGQSERNGNSVEPGLPNTILMPKARRRSKVACLTVTVLVVSLVCLRDTACFLNIRHCEGPTGPREARPDDRLRDEAIQSLLGPGLLRFARNDDLPRRPSLHGRLTGGVCRPQIQPGAIFIGVDGELSSLEKRLHAAIAELLRRRAAVQLGRQLDDERRLQRPMEDQ